MSGSNKWIRLLLGENSKSNSIRITRNKCSFNRIFPSGIYGESKKDDVRITGNMDY